MSILALNCGSSSVKYQLFDMNTLEVVCKGQIDRIGLFNSNISHKYGTEVLEKKEACPDHKTAIKCILDFLIKEAKIIKSISGVKGVGHRVVHGGEKFSKSVLIDEKVLKVIKKNAVLAPLHNPPNIVGIESAIEIMPNTPQIAIFDTAFHQTIPEHAYLYGLEYELYEKHNIRKYGFHGSSHRYVTEKAQEYLNSDKNKIITIHLGNGCSITAVKNGKSVDTSMGMTPLQGLVMGTRCGDIDPALVPHIMDVTNDTVVHVFNRLNKQSGLLGISGVSSDQRDIEKGAKEGNKRCELALKIQAYSIKKYIGIYLAVLNGADAIVFTGGIGENCPDVRAAACTELDSLGVLLDLTKNNKVNFSKSKEPVCISADHSLVKVLVIPTNEEFIIARDVKEIVSQNK